MNLEGDFVFAGNKLEEHVQLWLFKAFGHESTQKFLYLERIFVYRLFPIYEIL